MAPNTAIDFETYAEIKMDLLAPISGENLDTETTQRLYQSKLIYLEHLRTVCFKSINSQSNSSPFVQEDYLHILKAIEITKQHLRDFVLNVVRGSMG